LIRSTTVRVRKSWLNYELGCYQTVISYDDRPSSGNSITKS
jgi:hypothetical protein